MNNFNNLKYMQSYTETLKQLSPIETNELRKYLYTLFKGLEVMPMSEFYMKIWSVKKYKGVTCLKYCLNETFEGPYIKYMNK